MAAVLSPSRLADFKAFICEVFAGDLTEIARAPVGERQGLAAALVRKAANWDASIHPRGDDGRFISKDKLQAAKTDPKVAAELRARTTKPAERAKLDKVIGGEADPGRSAHGERRHQAQQRREAKGKAVGRAKEIAEAVGAGTATAADVQELAGHLDHLTVPQLQYLRSFTGGGAGKRKADVVASLLAAARDATGPAGGPEGDKAESLTGPAGHPDPLTLTPGNVRPVWEAMRDEIVAHDPKMSQAQAGSIAAARIFNGVGKRAAEFIAGIDARVRAGGDVTPEEDEQYINAQDARRNLHGALADLSGYRPHQSLDEHPLAQRPFDAPPLEDVAGKNAARRAELESAAGEVAASAAARKAGLVPVKGRIEWDGRAVEDPAGAKTVYRDADGNLYASIAEHGRKRQAAAQQQAAAAEQQRAAGEATKREQEQEQSRQQVRANAESVSRHFHDRLKTELRAAGFKGDLLRRVRYQLGGSALPDDAPKEAIDLRNRLVAEYSAAQNELGGLSASPDQVAAMLGKLSGSSTPSEPAPTPAAPADAPRSDAAAAEQQATTDPGRPATGETPQPPVIPDAEVTGTTNYGGALAQAGERWAPSHREAVLVRGDHGGGHVWRWEVRAGGNWREPVAAGPWTADRAAAESGWHAAGAEHGLTPPAPEPPPPPPPPPPKAPTPDQFDAPVTAPLTLAHSEYAGANKPWLARVTGHDPKSKYGFQQEFARPDRTERGANMRRNRHDHEWDVTEPGVYRVGGTAHGGKEDRFLAAVPDGAGGLRAVRLTADQAKAAAKAMSKGKSLPDALRAADPAMVAPPPKPTSRQRAAAKETAPPRAAEAVSRARHNAGKNPTPAALARSLAREYAHLHDSRGTPDELAHVAAELTKAGAVQTHNVGDPVPFDGATHAADTGVSTGAPVTVTRPGWVLPDPATGGSYVALPAKVKPAPKAAEPATPAPAAAPLPHLDPPAGGAMAYADPDTGTYLHRTKSGSYQTPLLDRAGRIAAAARLAPAIEKAWHQIYGLRDETGLTDMDTVVHYIRKNAPPGTTVNDVQNAVMGLVAANVGVSPRVLNEVSTLGDEKRRAERAIWNNDRAIAYLSFDHHTGGWDPPDLSGLKPA